MTTYQVVIKGAVDTDTQVRNVVHYSFPDYDPDDTEKQDFIDELDDDLKNRIQNFFNILVNIYAYEMRRVDIGNQPASEWIPTNLAWFGTGAADMLPAQLAALITWKAPTVFPRTTRTYLFPFGEGGNDADGTLTGAAQAAMNQLGGDWLEIVVPGQANAFKVAVKYSGDPRIVTSENIVLTTSVSQGRFASQRRRRIGVGI